MPFTIPQEILDLNPRCVPIRKGLKSPAIKNWPAAETRAKDMPTDDEQFDKYGIVIDEDMLVVDVDVHEADKNGWASLDRIERDHGIDLESAASIVVESPSGGAHLYFANPDLEKFPKSVREFPGLDFLGKGCQVIGPGSHHSSFSGTYKISRGRDLICDVPMGLAEVLNFQFEDVAQTSHVPEESPLDSFNTSTSSLSIIKDELEARGYTVITKGNDLYEFVRPGKRTSTYNISGTIGLKSKNGRLLLKNFSTNDPFGFPSGDGESITLAEAFRVLKGYSFDQLPSELRAIGYGAGSSISSDEIADIQAQIREARTKGDDLEQSYPTLTLDELKSKSPDRRPYVIEGLLRRGETMNLIAAPKTGKSWFVYNLAAKLATGGDFLGWTSPLNLKCMIVDNELHSEELAFRVGSVQDAMEVSFGDSLHFSCLRGAAVDMNHIEEKLVAAGASRFDVIILDALYRFIPAGTSENDNAQMMLIYNTIDRIARTFDCSVICVHHSSKGNQNEKQVSDVGAGAGAISRAADTQVVLFPHEQPGLVCIEAITRSSKTPAARSAKLDNFLWSLCEDDAVRKTDSEPKPDKKKIATMQNQMRRVARAEKVRAYLEEHPVIRPQDSQEVLGESKSVLRTLLRDHLEPAGVVVFKNFYYERAKEWEQRMTDFLVDPSTPAESQP